MFMCVVNLKSVNKLDLTWKQSFLILAIKSLPVTNTLAYFAATSAPKKIKLYNIDSRSGGKMVFLDKFEPKEFLKEIENYRVIKWNYYIVLYER
jgi:hypothetical protein